MKLINYIVYSFFLSLLVGHVSAQDIHFSQFFATPLSLSPSNTGNYEGDWRVMSNYRSQWKDIKPYTTQSIGGDARLLLGKGQLGVGLFVINDKSGGNLKVNKILLSAAYHKQVDQNSYSIGIQPGFVVKNIDYSIESYPSQADPDKGIFDNTLPNYETSLDNHLSYMDVNMGIGWKHMTKRFIPNVSLSVFHLNMPNESFSGVKNKLKPRALISAGCLWFSSSKWTLAPNVLYENTANTSELMLGTNLYMSLDKAYSIQKSVYAGVFFRQGFVNAAIATLGMNYKNYTAGFSYDMSLSGKKAATSLKGAIEFSLIYTAINPHVKQILIPGDIY